MNKPVFSPELIAAAIRQDEEALRVLYLVTQDQVTQTVRSMIRDEDAVLDIVQDSYVKGFRNLERLDKPENFLAWMRRIASNTAVDYMKKKKPLLFCELAEEDGAEPEFRDENISHLPEAMLDRQETARLIRQIVSGLSEEQQLAIGMFYFEEMPIRQIAQILGCSENTVKSRLNYGRKNIEKQVRELEKQGVKLYSLAPLPFFLWLLRNLHTKPSQDALDSILAHCGGAAAGAAGSAAGTAAAGAKAAAVGVKAAAGGAARGLAAKIIAGALAVTVLGGGAAVALSGGLPESTRTQRTSHAENRDSEPEPSDETISIDSSNPLITPTEPEIDPTPAYQEILDEYAAACADPDYVNHRDLYPHTGNEAMNTYHTFGAFDLYYAYYDLDGNGVEELLIGDGGVLDVYAFDGNQAVALIHEPNIGWRTFLTVMETGELYVSGSSGAALGDSYMVRLAEDGFSTESVFYYEYDYENYGNVYHGMNENGPSALTPEEFDALIGSYTELELDWEILCKAPMTCYEAYQVILDEYSAAAKAYSDGDYDPERFPHTVNYAMTGPSTGRAVDFFYIYLDMDQNGTSELIIGYQEIDDGQPLPNIAVLNVYTFDGTQAVQMFQDPNLGGTSYLTITEYNEVYHFTDRSQSCLRIADDGFSPEVIYSYQIRMEGNEEIYYNDTEELTSTDLYWKWGPYYNYLATNEVTWNYLASR